MTGAEIGVDAFARELALTPLVRGRETILFTTPDINRPGLQFTGYYEYFAEQRVQLCGNAEIYYLYGLTPEALEETVERFMATGIPCVVCARDKQPPAALLASAEKYGVPVFRSALHTGEIGNRITRYLQNKLAPRILIHGVLLEVFGVGVLLRGPSGLGKSETALELVKNGHQLVADDVVEIKRIADTLVGTAPAATRHMIEVRGLGVMDVRYLFGVGAAQLEAEIDMIMDLELWNERTEYNRTGAEDHAEEILGVQVPATLLPVSPGRNLATVIGAAARHFRLKRMGYETVLRFPER